jgi:D-alanine-D-alanine ligase
MSDMSRVVVIAGGLSPEREVSLHSGRRITDALRQVGVDVELRDIDRELLPALTRDAASVAFPVLHGITGEDGTIKEILELAGVPYVGSRPWACRNAFDKTIAKSLLTQAGLRTPDSVTLPKQAFHDLGAAALAARVIDRLGPDLFVKPRSGGSAFGVTRVANAAQLPEALMAAFAYHDEALVERRVSGTEIAIGVVDTGDGPVALPAVEIVPDGLYDYSARYTQGAVKFFTPARLPEGVAQKAAQAAVSSHSTLGLRDLSRVDAIVTDQGSVFALEVNIAPGMTATSTFPLALTEAGYDFGGFCRDLAMQAARRSGTGV